MRWSRRSPGLRWGTRGAGELSDRTHTDSGSQEERRTPTGRAAFALPDFFDPGLVVCPRCGGAAEVWNPRAALPLPVLAEGAGPVTLRCRDCVERREEGWRLPGADGPRDPWFGCPLWAQAAGRYGAVWVVSPAHLAALRAHVLRPDLSGRPVDSNRDWRARTPGWMSSRKNREHVLKLLARLQRRFAEAGLGVPA